MSQFYVGSKKSHGLKKEKNKGFKYFLTQTFFNTFKDCDKISSFSIPISSFNSLKGKAKLMQNKQLQTWHSHAPVFLTNSIYQTNIFYSICNLQRKS